VLEARDKPAEVKPTEDKPKAEDAKPAAAAACSNSGRPGNDDSAGD
jgi:hypothetical protein